MNILQGTFKQVSHFMLGLGLLLVFALPSLAQDGDGIGTISLSQWASSAEASSQYGDDGWSANRATGAPDVLACEDSVNSWASLTASDGETLTLYYDVPVVPIQVNVYQNYSPGAISSISIIPADGRAPIVIDNSADVGEGCPRVFSMNMPSGLPEAIGVIITLDQADMNNWNEIDAVELYGSTMGEPGDTEPSSLDMNDYPMYELSSNTPMTGPSGNNPQTGPSGNTPQTGPSGNANTGNNTSTGTTAADFGGEWGTTVTCPDGMVITNAVQFTIVQQRSGNQYRVSALGINGFDPVLAVMDDYGNMLCNDDSSDVAGYGANLPTTGQIAPATTNSQVIFNLNSSNAFENVTVVVGGYQGTGGEVLVTVEGMVASSADGIGDPFSVYASPAMLVSGVDPTAYMISVVSRFDPTILLVTGDYEQITFEGQNVACDDAGTTNCWGESASLANGFVSRSGGRNLAGGRLDSMLTIPLEGTWGVYLNYVMTSFGGTYGDYIAAFHLGTAAEGQ
jgi:hypothetical protein